MRRAILRDLLAHRVRLVMTLAAIALGVAFVVAAWVVSESTARALAGGDTRSGVAVAVYATAEPATLTAADVDRLAALDGVTHASGVRTGRSGLVGSDGELVDAGLERAGTDWDGTGRFDLVDGREPRGDDEVVLRAEPAARAGLSAGDRVRVLLSEGRSDTFTVVGTFDYRPIGPRTASGAHDTEPEPVPLVAYAPGAAQELLGGHLDRIELAAEPGGDPDELAAEAARLLGDGGHRVTTGAELAAEARRAAEETAADIRAQLLPFAAVALLAGVFVIANTFTTLTTRRLRRFALLRAVGARRAQVWRAAIGEAALLGTAGSTLGVLLGGVGGLVASAFLEPGGAGPDASGHTVPPAGIAAGYLAGVVVTVLAAHASARRAAAVPPVAALRAGTTGSRMVTSARTILGATAIPLGAVAIVATASPSVDTVSRLVGIGGAALAATGILLLVPALVAVALPPLLRGAERCAGIATRLGLRNAARDPRRTAATASALMVGLTLIGVFATLSASLERMAASSIRATVPETTTVVRPAVDGASLDPADVAAIEALPEVSAAVASRDSYATIHHAGGSTERILTAVDADGFDEVLRPEIVAGTADLDRGALVSKNQADILGLAPGDGVTLELGEGATVRTTVVGTYEGTEMQASLYFAAADAPRSAPADVTMVHATGPAPEAARKAVAAAFGDRPDVTVSDRRGHIEDRLAEFRIAMRVVYAMFGFAIAIGVLGTVNTLALSVMERTREIGVLCAVGGSRRLIRRAVRAESVAVSLLGGLLGTATGVGAGTVVQHSMLGRRLSDVAVPFPLIGIALAGMVVAGVLAAVWPARRAARGDVLRAVADD